MECSVAAGNSAHRQRRGGVTSLGDFFGVSGCVPDYWCNVSDHYPSRYVCCYFGVRGGRSGRIFRVLNTDPLGSCVPNSGFRSENVFLKGAGYHRRLYSVEQRLQQRPLYCTRAWRRASSERRSVHMDKSVSTTLFVTVQTLS